jgi:hypothetical protein
MRGGKEHARASQPTQQDGGEGTSGSTPTVATSGPSASRDNATQSNIASVPDTQPSETDDQSESLTRTSPESSTGAFQGVLVDCNALVEEYRRGEISKAAVYVEIQTRLARALGDNRSRSDAAFGSFIATIESHDSEIGAAARRGGAAEQAQRSPSPPISVSDGQPPDDEPATKKIKVDESAYAWIASRKGKQTILRDTLSKTLKLIEIYTVDPKATKRSLINEPNCPEFPDSEWKNVIAGRAVNLDAVLSGQLSTTHNDPKIEKFGDLEISFGAVEPTKLVKNGGEWSIAWNRTVRATVFAFPHRMQELISYGEYIVNLFAVTHPSVHSRVVAFDKAVRKRIGSVRNLELCDFDRFADLKIAHMDSIGVSVISGSSKEDGGKKGKRGKNWRKDEPCNKWNDGKCNQAEEDCRRQHVCNKCGKAGHKGKECKKA